MEPQPYTHNVICMSSSIVFQWDSTYTCKNRCLQGRALPEHKSSDWGVPCSEPSTASVMQMPLAGWPISSDGFCTSGAPVAAFLRLASPWWKRTRSQGWPSVPAATRELRGARRRRGESRDGSETLLERCGEPGQLPGRGCSYKCARGRARPGCTYLPHRPSPRLGSLGSLAVAAPVGRRREGSAGALRAVPDPPGSPAPAGAAPHLAALPQPGREGGRESREAAGGERLAAVI